MLLSRFKNYLQEKNLVCIIYKTMPHRADYYKSIDFLNILIIGESTIIAVYCSSDQLTETIG